jgi:hypothetical protein
MRVMPILAKFIVLSKTVVKYPSIWTSLRHQLLGIFFYYKKKGEFRNKKQNNNKLHFIELIVKNKRI